MSLLQCRADQIADAVRNSLSALGLKNVSLVGLNGLLDKGAALFLFAEFWDILMLVFTYAMGGYLSLCRARSSITV